jgi:hypothetical protein
VIDSCKNAPKAKKGATSTAPGSGGAPNGTPVQPQQTPQPQGTTGK